MKYKDLVGGKVGNSEENLQLERRRRGWKRGYRAVRAETVFVCLRIGCLEVELQPNKSAIAPISSAKLHTHLSTLVADGLREGARALSTTRANFAKKR